MVVLAAILDLIYQMALSVVVSSFLFCIYELFKPKEERIKFTVRYFWLYFPSCVIVVLHSILKG